MTPRAAAWVCLAALLGAGCAPGISVRREGERPRDPAPLWQALQDYNAAPRAVRVQGRLAVRGHGSAQFGARAAAGMGLRLDAVAGPFGRP